MSRQKWVEIMAGVWVKEGKPIDTNKFSEDNKCRIKKNNGSTCSKNTEGGLDTTQLGGATN